MKILITYALEDERGNIQMPGCTLAFRCTGVGKVSAAINTYEALQNENPDLVLNVGTAGTLSRRVGDIVVCSRFVDRDLLKIAHLGVNCRLDFNRELEASDVFKELCADGTVNTGDTFQTSTSESGTEGDVFDMEAYATAQVCKKLGIPFVSVKFVTDVIGQNSIRHWEEKLEDAREGLAEFLNGLRF